MAERTDPIVEFSGGISQSEALGIPNSFRFAKHLNIHRDPSFVTLYPKTTKISSTTVVDLIKWIEDGSPYDTNRYAFGDAGKFYKITSGDVLSVLATKSDSHGNGFLMLEDWILLANDKTLDRYGPLSGTPADDNGFIEDDTINLFESLTDTSNTYSLTTGVDEGATHRQTLNSDTIKDPILKIALYVTAKGTGNWTVTVHDNENNEIGTATITNASLSNGAYNDFSFTTPLRINKQNTYHIHVHSTVADGTAGTTDSGDFETGAFKAYYAALINHEEHHPMIEHLGKAVIGNDRYMATMEGAAASTYDPNRVPIGQGFVIRKFAKDEEFVVAIATKGQSDDEIEEARLYWWEGTLDRPSFSRPFPAGLLHLIHTDDKGRLVLIAGNRAKIYIGTGGKEFTKIQEAPKLADKKKIKLYPGAITNWQERTLIGYSNTDDANFVQGVYEFAHNNDLLPEVLNHMFTISTGDSQDTDIKIGCLRGFGQDLYISWLGADGSTYGLDKVEIDDDPAATGSYESLIVDNGNPHKEKRLDKIIIVHDGLGTGQEVIAKYKLDREASWNTGSQKGASTYNDTADSKFTELDVAKNYFELEFGFDLIATTTYPKIKAIVLIWDDLGVETSESDINL